MRKLRVEDLFSLEQIGGYYFGGPFDFSSDGKTLAYVVQRAKKTATTHRQVFLTDNDRADVWVIDLPSGEPENITNGVADGAGFWQPSWSPDGRRLAMVSTRGGNVTLWVWEKETGNCGR